MMLRAWTQKSANLPNSSDWPVFSHFPNVSAAILVKRFFVRMRSVISFRNAFQWWDWFWKIRHSWHWKTLTRGCTTVLRQNMQSNAIREHSEFACALSLFRIAMHGISGQICRHLNSRSKKAKRRWQMAFFQALVASCRIKLGPASCRDCWLQGWPKKNAIL